MIQHTFTCNICESLIPYSPRHQFGGVALMAFGKCGFERTEYRECDCPDKCHVHICLDCTKGLGKFFKDQTLTTVIAAVTADKERKSPA